MPTAVCDGIETRYEIRGDGPPLLLVSPGGFNGRLENWWRFGIYERLHLVDTLQERFSCIVFDKRESGESGGRIERIAWDDYARQAVGLLDELGIERAHLMGGCIGCSIVLHCEPARVRSMVLYSPAGGAQYRKTQLGRFAEHAAFVADVGLDGVVEHVRATDRNFAQDPRVGPWVSVLRRDDAFAAEYAAQDPDAYRVLVDDMAHTLFDLDTVPGAPAELLERLDGPALVVPGNDESHATSAALHLAEGLPHAEYWDVMPDGQTSDTAPRRVLEFLSEQ